MPTIQFLTQLFVGYYFYQSLETIWILHFMNIKFKTKIKYKSYMYSINSEIVKTEVISVFSI